MIHLNPNLYNSYTYTAQNDLQSESPQTPAAANPSAEEKNLLSTYQVLNTPLPSSSVEPENTTPTPSESLQTPIEKKKTDYSSLPADSLRALMEDPESPTNSPRSFLTDSSKDTNAPTSIYELLKSNYSYPPHSPSSSQQTGEPPGTPPIQVVKKSNLASSGEIAIQHLQSSLPDSGSKASEYQKLNHEYPFLDPLFSAKSFTAAHQKMIYNRYPNILPFDKTRTKLPNDPDFYFNANWVLGGEEVIACQGPLPYEIENFWKMMWETNTPHIVALGNPIEKNLKKTLEKFSMYWVPFSGKQFKILSYHDTVSKLTSRTNPEIFMNITERNIEVVKDSETKIFTQYHIDWPDFGTLDPDILAQFVTYTSEKIKTDRLAVHCSAGIGRTGTFLATFQANRIKSKDLYSIVGNLRKERNGMVQTQAQYDSAKKAVDLLLPNTP